MAKPTIGIRPIIDGRWGGVRESLEGKTMAMAQAAKALIEANVFLSLIHIYAELFHNFHQLLEGHVNSLLEILIARLLIL